MELKPVFSPDTQLPEYLETKLLTRELTNIFLRGAHVLLDKHPVTVEQARALQDTWPGDTRVYTVSDIGQRDEDIVKYYKDNGALNYELSNEAEMEGLFYSIYEMMHILHITSC